MNEQAPVAWRKVDPLEVPPWHGSWNNMREPQKLYRDEQEAGFIIEYAYLAPVSESTIRAKERERTIEAMQLATDFLNEVRAEERKRFAPLLLALRNYGLDDLPLSQAFCDACGGQDEECLADCDARKVCDAIRELGDE